MPHGAMKGEIRNLSSELTRTLLELERRVGFELTINSGYRDPQHNEDVGGVQGSEHTDDPANGADVLCLRSVTRYKLVKALIEMHVTRIGIGETFVHVGVSTGRPQEVVWHYYEKKKPMAVDTHGLR